MSLSKTELLRAKLSAIIRSSVASVIMHDRWLRQLDRWIEVFEEHTFDAIQGFSDLARELPPSIREDFRTVLKENKLSGNLSDNNAELDFDVGIVCARRVDELRPVLDLMVDRTDISSDREGRQDAFTFHEGWFRKSDQSLRVVAAAQHVMGMSDCASLCTKIVLRYRPRFLVMTGVAGGRSGKVNIGDIIIAEEVFNYQAGKYTEAGFEPACTPLRLDVGLHSRFADREQAFAAEIAERWTDPHVRVPRIHIAPMACGAGIVDLRGAMEAITDLNRNVVAVDMESYSVYRACELARPHEGNPQTHPVVIKGIMDLTEEKSDAAKPFAAFASAQYLYHFALAEWSK